MEEKHHSDIHAKEEFQCEIDGCKQSFPTEGHRSVHTKKHDLNLSLELPAKEGLFADQTPTPTRLIGKCEEVGLFEDLQKVNPFDETFRRAVESGTSSAEQSPLVSEPTVPCCFRLTESETLHTPHIFPSSIERTSQDGLGAPSSMATETVVKQRSIDNGKATKQRSNRRLTPVKRKTPAVVDILPKPSVLSVSSLASETIPFIIIPSGVTETPSTTLPTEPTESAAVKEKLKEHLAKVRESGQSGSKEGVTGKKRVKIEDESTEKPTTTLEKISRTKSNDEQATLKHERWKAAAKRYRKRVKESQDHQHQRNIELEAENRRLRTQLAEFKHAHRNCSVTRNASTKFATAALLQGGSSKIVTTQATGGSQEANVILDQQMLQVLQQQQQQQPIALSTPQQRLITSHIIDGHSFNRMPIFIVVGAQGTEAAATAPTPAATANVPSYSASKTMTVERVDTFYDLDSIYSTIERMLVLIRQLSGVARLGENGRSLSFELQWSNVIDERKYQIDELRCSVQYLFAQFRKIYLVNKDLYAQLNKRGGRVFELDKQIEAQGDIKCLYFMADAIKYEPALLAMQRVLDRTMREIRIFRNQRNQHKLELCVGHIRCENYDKVYDEYCSFENGPHQLPLIVEAVFENDMRNLLKILLFLNGYRKLNKANSSETFVAGCELMLGQMKQSYELFEHPLSLLLYGFVVDALQERPELSMASKLKEVFHERLEIVRSELIDCIQRTVRLIQTDPQVVAPLARLFHHLEEELLIELLKRAYEGDVLHLQNILQFVAHLSCIDHDIVSYRVLYAQMEHYDHIYQPEIFLLAYRIKQTMLDAGFASASLRGDLERLKANLPPVVVSILWSTVTISRHESRILLKFSAVGKDVGFSRYIADKNRIEFEPLEDGNCFRMRATTINGFLGESGTGVPMMASKSESLSNAKFRWKLIPWEGCEYFRVQNYSSGAFLYSQIPCDESEYDFYNSKEVLQLTGSERTLTAQNSYWKVVEYARGGGGGGEPGECRIL
uniref:C2H2-type domain-containing protein n=1 Tax=Anopheles farauti TaxID=69004 RepID=A0A182QQR2_9DIPT